MENRIKAHSVRILWAEDHKKIDRANFFVWLFIVVIRGGSGICLTHIQAVQVVV